MHRAIPVLLSLLLLVAPKALAQKSLIDLRPKWEKGQEIRYRMDQTSTQQTKSPPGAGASMGGESGGLDAAQSMVQAVDLRMKVIDADPEGGAIVHLIYDRFKVSIDSPLNKGEFDSTSPKEKDTGNPLAAMLRPMVGATLVLTLDRDGNITQIEGGDNLIPGGLGGTPADALTNPKELKKTWAPLFTTRRASGRATVGDKWTTTDSMDLSLIGSFLINTDNHLRSHKSGAALIDFKGTITPGPESAGALPIQIKDSKHEGTCTWDTQRGQLKDLSMTQTVNIEVELTGSKITSKQDSKTTIRRVN